MPHYDISGFSQGSTYSLLFRAVDSVGTPISLSGYNIRSTIRESYADSTGVASFNSVITVPESGICNLSMSATNTALIPAKIYLWDCEAYTSSESDVIKLLYGHLYCNPQVSY